MTRRIPFSLLVNNGTISEKYPSAMVFKSLCEETLTQGKPGPAVSYIDSRLLADNKESALSKIEPLGDEAVVTGNTFLFQQRRPQKAHLLRSGSPLFQLSAVDMPTFDGAADFA
jgi:hypothetical protein